MFDKYIIVENATGNLTEAGKTSGYRVGVRIPYYRGLGISMIEDLSVTTDGVPVPRNEIEVWIHGNAYTLNQMETEPDDRWEFGETGTLVVRNGKGLAPGKHKIEVAVKLRISYMPVPSVTKCEKEIVFS